MLQGMRSARLVVDLSRQGESTDHHWRLAVDSNDAEAGPEGLVLGDDGNGIVGLDDLDLAEMGVLVSGSMAGQQVGRTAVVDGSMSLHSDFERRRQGGAGHEQTLIPRRIPPC